MDVEAPPSLTPHMLPEEMACFARYAAEAQQYLEFGCGGSTVAAAIAGARRIDSVESDAEWIAKCEEAPELAPRVADGTMRFHHVEIGPVRGWGRPRGDAFAVKWPSYYLDVWTKLENLPDVVLIDGRFRVACALQALLRCEDGATILFHDFWNRRGYHVVLDFTDEVERAKKLAVLRRKPSPDWRKMALLVAEHALNFA